MRIFSTKDIDKIIERFNKGGKITRKNNIFFRNQEGTLDDNIMIVLTHDELTEYSLCANDVCYFIETYCNIKLRSFQREWIDSFMTNRFMLYCTSRQTGYSQVMAAVYLHYLIFNKNKNILVMSNIGGNACEFISKLLKYYLRLPYFMKPGLVSMGGNKIEFNNGNKILAQARAKIPPIGYTVDLMSYLEFTHVPHNSMDPHYDAIFTELLKKSDSRLCIQSQPNGFDRFYQLITDSERKPKDPKKNCYKTIKTYWWEVEGRDEAWKNEEIKNMGSVHAFDQEYDIQFFSYSQRIADKKYK